MSETLAQEHTLPAELCNPAPRKVVRRPGTLGISTVVGRIFFIPVAVFGLYVLGWAPIKAIVIFGGQTVSGRVDGRETSSGKTTRCYIQYSYIIAGESHNGRHEVEDVTEFDKIKVGQPIPVHVARIFDHYFDEVILDGERPAKAVLDQLMLAFVPSGLFTGGLFGILFVQYWLQKRLCRHGTSVPGRITQKKISRSKSCTYYELHYEFAHPRLGISKSHNYIAPSQWVKAKRGEIVTVLCNPRRGAHASVLYEYGNFMCV